MFKALIFTFFLSAGLGTSLLPAQLPFEIGTGFSYDYGVNFKGTQGYEPYGKGRLAMLSFDAYMRIPFLRIFSIYPTYIFSIPSRSLLVKNQAGDYIPQGYGLDLPWSPDNPDYFYGEDYYDLTSEVEIWQQQYGAFLTVHLGGGIEIGSGIFLRNRKTLIYDYLLYDEYSYSSSTGNQWDHYAYSDTYGYGQPGRVSKTRKLSPAVPLLLTYSYYFDGWFYMGANFITWFVNDTYLSFRYTMGIQF